MFKITFLCLCILSSALSEVVEYTFDVREWVVDFKRPTVELKSPAERKNPFQVPAEARKGAILINGQYPAPPVDVFLNDTVRITVVNNMISEATSIHWHGVHPFETPWTDGVRIFLLVFTFTSLHSLIHMLI